MKQKPVGKVMTQKKKKEVIALKKEIIEKKKIEEEIHTLESEKR